MEPLEEHCGSSAFQQCLDRNPHLDPRPSLASACVPCQILLEIGLQGSWTGCIAGVEKSTAELRMTALVLEGYAKMAG